MMRPSADTVNSVEQWKSHQHVQSVSQSVQWHNGTSSAPLRRRGADDSRSSSEGYLVPLVYVRSSYSYLYNCISETSHNSFNDY